MGFFSWITQDTQRSIPNKYSEHETFTVYMTDNKGNIWEEEDYEGYGRFGGKDFYELLAEMNGLESDRQLGIDLAFSDKAYISPNLNESKQVEWKNVEPETCRFQGFFYENEEE
jgi:hypothetical protein